MRIAIYADPLMGKGGGSKVIIDLANHLNADIFTSGFNNKLRAKLKKNIKIMDIGNISIHKNYSFGYLFEAPLRYLFYKKKTYDLNIYIGTFSIFSSHKNEKNIWLSLTPNRIIYDLKEWKLQTASPFKKIIYLLHAALFQKKDQEVIRNNFNKIVTQNMVVQKRIKKYYDKDATIIHSSIPVGEYMFNKFGDYFLTVSRLLPEKRIDLTVKSFAKLTSQKLVIVGDGPEKNRIREMIKEHKNIILHDSVDDTNLRKLYADCLATIYVPLNEDFGLVPLEGMASGKACIAVNEGGCKETVLPGKTGLLVTPSVQGITSAVKSFDVNKAKSMKTNCLSWARNFDTAQSMKLWEKEVKTVIN